MRFNIYIICLVALIFNCDNAPAKTLEEVQKRGYLQCGVSQRLPGFSFTDDAGDWSGLDVDICRAVAAAIFKENNKVRFIPLSATDRFTALQSGEIDILSRNTTWNFTRDASLGLQFTNITFYDGQGFLVPTSAKITSIRQLANATICTNSGTTSEVNLADYFRSHNISYKILTFQKDDEVVAAYNAGRCDAYSSDRAGLASQRLKLSNPDAHIILNDVISKEPLGPVVRQDDPQWVDLVRWVVFGLINAEEYGIRQSNVYDMKKSMNVNIMRLLGVNQNLGKYLGLDAEFMIYAIAQVGNYGEIFSRNLGADSILNLPRGLNNLWSSGGIMYAPPFD